MTSPYDISRTQVLIRARYGWPFGTVPFDRLARHEGDGYRTDSAGFVCVCFRIPLHVQNSIGGLTTPTLLTDGWFYEIERHDLQPGDVAGYLGPQSADADGGVIAVFEGWLKNDMSNGYAMLIELLPRSSPGPTRMPQPLGPKWHAYRYKYITD